jgi:type II protein arginine methyltransferase
MTALTNRQVLQHEISNASYCGVTTVLIPPPGRSAGIQQYASVLHSILRDTQVQLSVLIPLQEDRASHLSRDEGSIWQVWNTVQSLTSYHPRLSVALQLSERLPSLSLTRQWFAEPVRVLLSTSETFLPNSKGYPVLPKALQNVMNSFLKVSAQHAAAYRS